MKIVYINLLVLDRAFTIILKKQDMQAGQEFFNIYV